MKACFGTFVKILKSCAKPKVTNKSLCGAVIKTIDESEGEILETEDSYVSHLLRCDYGLSADIVEKARESDLHQVSRKMATYVLPLIDENNLPVAILAFRSLLTDSVSDEIMIGAYSRKALVEMQSIDPSDFFANSFLYVASNINNKYADKAEKEDIKHFLSRFESKRESITIQKIAVVEPLELDRTLKDSGFEMVFHKVEVNGQLSTSNRSDANVYYLDIADSEFDYAKLYDYLFDCVGMYVYNRTRVQEFKDKKKIQSLCARALRIMQKNGAPGEKGTGNDLGEMLLYVFLEEGLRAPKLLSKVEIANTSPQFKSNSDSVHLLKLKINGKIHYQLVFGASCIENNIYQAIDHSFGIIKKIKQRKRTERSMVDNTLMNHTYDQETTEQLREILIPSKNQIQEPDMAFGVFVGYSIEAANENNDQFRNESLEKMKNDLQSVIPYIQQKIVDCGLAMHSYYFYFLPFNNAENDKRTIMKELLVGGDD